MGEHRARRPGRDAGMSADDPGEVSGDDPVPNRAGRGMARIPDDASPQDSPIPQWSRYVIVRGPDRLAHVPPAETGQWR